MSQFNSIFSPLTNKLARLAGITLLAVAALFASTQQIAAQAHTCVTSLEVRLGESGTLAGTCATEVTVDMVLLGGNTASRANMYVVINDLNPTNNGTVGSGAAIVDGISPASGWTYGVYEGLVAGGPRLVCTGVIYAVDYSAPKVIAPAAVDSLWCDDVNSVLNRTDSWQTTTDVYFTGNISRVVVGADGAQSPAPADNCAGNLQIRVTDEIAYTECGTTLATTYPDGAANDGKVWATITRRFKVTDQRGNDTTVTQLIRFVRPTVDRIAGPIMNGGAGYGLINGKSVWSTNSTTKNNGGTYVANNTTSGVDEIIFDNCSTSDIPTNKETLRPYLRSLYRSGSGKQADGKSDTLFLYDGVCNYAVDFTFSEFATYCNNGKKFLCVTSISDVCAPSANVTLDTVMLVFTDKSAPVWGVFNSQVAENVGTSSSPVIVSTGVNTCDGSLRLALDPSNVTTTAASLRDLANIFNLKVTDACTNGVTLSYQFATDDYFYNNFYYDPSGSAGTYTDTSYTISGGTALFIPVGNHRLTITAFDRCNNTSVKTIHFRVVDKVAPVMKCDDNINVTLTSNSSTNFYVNGRGQTATSNNDLAIDQSARVYLSDINEGSRDNCAMDSMYVRRKFAYTNETSGIFPYLKLNPDYDIFGSNNNGTVAINDFEAVPGTTQGEPGMYYTPKHMQYVEVFCVDGATPLNPNNDYGVMVELWGSDLTHQPGPAQLNNVRNWSFCWMNINIEDKIRPTITAPNLNATYNLTNSYKGNTVNVTNWVNCTEKEIIGTSSSSTDGAIANEAASNLLFGKPDIFGLECKGDVVYSVSKTLTCDTGTIVRKWVISKELKPGLTIKDSTTQTIYVRANHNFSITVPKDNTSTSCGTADATDLVLDEAGCDLLAVSYKTEKYDAAPGDNFCYKIYRTGTVINWCMVPNHLSCAASDPAAYAVTIPRNTTSSPVKYTFTLAPTATGRNQLPADARTGNTEVQVAVGTSTTKTNLTAASGFVVPALTSCFTKAGFAYNYTQIIKVQDVVRPIVASGADWTPATAAADVAAGINWNDTKKSFSISGKLATPICEAKVKLTFAASDACINNDVELEKVELLNAGTDQAATTATYVSGLTGNTVNGIFTVEYRNVAVGNYDLRVTVRDDCGNVTVSRLTNIKVEDNKAPAPVCVQILTATLMPNGAGGCMVVVKATDFFQNTNRDWDAEECTGPVTPTMVLMNGDNFISTRGLEDTLTSENLNGVTARVYLKDAQGNEDYCTVTIVVEDNFCGNGTTSAAVAGAIQTETKATVEGVQVNLSGQSQKSFATGVNGLFIFNNLTAGADYTVTPSLNKGFLNGVSTFDLVLISKHILGVQPLNTPYKLIAADVNNSKSVTTLDLIQLRKLILNIDATFANNSSWRFVDASYTFPNASNPWAASFPEVKNVNDLEGSLSANFVAVKVGDVNGNAIANSTQGSVRNLTSNLGINVADMNLVAGNEYKVDFTAADLNGIEGFQFTLNLDKKGLELVDLVPGIAAEENFGIFAEEGVVTASWNGEAKGGVLFSLVVRAKSNTTLSEVLNLNSRYTAAEAYKGGEVVNVGLNFNASKASANYELYQNTPNPFAGESIIGFNLPAAGAATLTIQDVTGRTLKVINGQYAKGYNQVSLKSTELSATGVLTYTLKAADFTATRKMIIVE